MQDDVHWFLILASQTLLFISVVVVKFNAVFIIYFTVRYLFFFAIVTYVYFSKKDIFQNWNLKLIIFVLVFQLLLTITLVILHFTLLQNIRKDDIRGHYLQVFVIEDIIQQMLTYVFIAVDICMHRTMEIKWKR